MKRDFSRLETDIFDAIIIGGGIIGTGIARDATLRGFKVLLVEKEDFAYGTTSRSTRLIHGGLRYLRMLDFKLVYQDLREREILAKIAPHLVHRLQFVIPRLKQTPFYRFALPLGLKLYNLLSHGTSLPGSHDLSVAETLELEPCLKNTSGLTGSYLYYDYQVEYPERLCLENALDAAANGATVLNHATMTDFVTENGAVTGIHLTDNLTGTDYGVRGRLTLNTGGPWAGQVLQKLAATRGYSIRTTKGIHLLAKKIADHALVLFAKSDGRLFFVIPWLDYSLIGTTDTDYTGDKDAVRAEKADIDYLVREMQHYFPNFSEADVLNSYAGLRPLVPSGRKSASNTSRSHRLIDHERTDGVKGFISVLGGKITAYRGIAEEAVDLLGVKLNRRVACVTASTPLPGASAAGPDAGAEAKRSGVSVETVKHLSSIYGSLYTMVLDYLSGNRQLGKAICAGGLDILAQIKYAVLEEAALTVDDFMLRRSFLGLLPSLCSGAAETAAEEMAYLLGWNRAEQQGYLQHYLHKAGSGILPG